MAVNPFTRKRCWLCSSSGLQKCTITYICSAPDAMLSYPRPYEALTIVLHWLFTKITDSFSIAMFQPLSPHVSWMKNEELPPGHSDLDLCNVISLPLSWNWHLQQIWGNVLKAFFKYCIHKTQDHSNLDLWPPKSNQFIFESELIFVQSLKEIPQGGLVICSQECRGWTDRRMDSPSGPGYCRHGDVRRQTLKSVCRINIISQVKLVQFHLYSAKSQH